MQLLISVLLSINVCWFYRPQNDVIGENNAYIPTVSTMLCGWCR